MSDFEAVTANEAFGLDAEREARRRFELGLVPDEVAEHYDAVFVRDCVTGPEARVTGVTAAAAGTLVEVKATTLRIADAGTTRFGRFFIDRENHEHLLAADGEYVLLVHDGEREEWAACRLVAAHTVDEHIDDGEWVANGDHREGARPPWSRFMDPAEVLGSGGGSG